MDGTDEKELLYLKFRLMCCTFTFCKIPRIPGRKDSHAEIENSLSGLVLYLKFHTGVANCDLLRANNAIYIGI